MKISEIDISFLKNYLKISYETTQEDEAELLAFLSAAKKIVEKHTGLTSERCDEAPELTIAVLILTADMFDRREAFIKVSDAAPNRTLERILALSDENFL